MPDEVDTANYTIDASNNITFNSVGEYTVTYTTTDNANNSESEQVSVRFMESYLTEILENALQDNGIQITTETSTDTPTETLTDINTS